MLSYQHAYHAGNAADLHKHVALAVLLERLTEKPRGISYLESHAGRGLYDLSGAEARKTGEAEGGIGRMAPEALPAPFARAIAACRAAHGAEAYPGSPALAAALLRAQDRMALCELHPGEHAALRQAMAGGPVPVALHRRDGHEGLLALAPPTPRRGLALIDPSYEVKDEYARSAATLLALVRRWPQGVAMLWYPILPAGRHEAMAARVMAAGPAAALRHEVRFRERPERGMQGSGLLILGLPHGAEAALRTAWAGCAAVFEAG